MSFIPPQFFHCLFFLKVFFLSLKWGLSFGVSLFIIYTFVKRVIFSISHWHLRKLRLHEIRYFFSFFSFLDRSLFILIVIVISTNVVDHTQIRTLRFTVSYRQCQIFTVWLIKGCSTTELLIPFLSEDFKTIQILWSSTVICLSHHARGDGGTQSSPHQHEDESHNCCK